MASVSSNMSEEEEEEDLAVLIYKSSKTAQARAAAAAKEKQQMTASGGRQTSTRNRSCDTQDDGESIIDRPGKKRAVSKKRQFQDGSQKAEGKTVRSEHSYHVNIAISEGNVQIKLKREECAVDTGQSASDAAVRDAQMVLSVKECATDMEQRRNYVEAKDVQIKPKWGECALDMGQSASDAAVRDAQMVLSVEECATDMEQRRNYVEAKDVQIKPKWEECATDMGQSASDAAVRDAQMVLSVEECATDMGQSASDEAVGMHKCCCQRRFMGQRTMQIRRMSKSSSNGRSVLQT
eukprot:scaffold4016_cov116-Skeletonema_menzelii.AAC.3